MRTFVFRKLNEGKDFDVVSNSVVFAKGQWADRFLYTVKACRLGCRRDVDEIALGKYD